MNSGRETVVSEQQGDATNVWGGSPQVAPPPAPVPPREPQHDQTSASERAFAEGWPAQPGWVPEGGVGTAWGAAPAHFEAPQQQYAQPYQPETYQPQTQQAAWIPSQSPYPTSPDPYPGAGGYQPAGPAYPGPDAPLPRSNSTTVIVSIVVAVLLIAGVIGGVVFLKRDSGNTPVANTGTAPAGGTASTGAGTGSTGGKTQGSTGSSGSSSSGSSGTPSSGSTGSTGTTSTTPPMTSSTSIDLTTVHVPAYAASPDANDIAHTLDAYFTGINSGDYETAWNQLTATQQSKNPYSQFAEDTQGTIDQDVTVTAVTVRGDGSANASVTFTSTQPGDKGVNPGETCTDWAITYSLQLGDGAGGWLISGTPSAQHTAC